MVEVSDLVVVGKSKGRLGSTETPDDGAVSSVDEVDGTNVIPGDKVVTGRSICDGIYVAAVWVSTSSAGTKWIHYVQIIEWVSFKTGVVDRHVIK